MSTEAGKGKLVMGGEAAIELVTSPADPLLYADGIHGVVLGSSVSKLQFYQVQHTSEDDSGQPKEKRKVVLTLAVPTSNLLEMLGMVFGSMRASGEELKKMFQNDIEKLSQHMK